MDVIVVKAFDNPDSTGYITLDDDMGVASAACLWSQSSLVAFFC
jgi:hypothetical protein